MKIAVIIYLIIASVRCLPETITIRDGGSEKLECPFNATIVILNVVYGSNDCNQCIQTSQSCPNNITDYIKSLCDNKNFCIIQSDYLSCIGKIKVKNITFSCYLENLIFVPEIENKYTTITLNNFYDEFVVSFVILSNGESITSIFAITYIEEYMVDLSINIDTLSIAILNVFSHSITLTPNTWSSIVVSKHFISDNKTYNITVAVNGTVQYSNISTQPMVFADVILCTFCECRFPPNCNFSSIKNLSVFIKTQVYCNQWSNWSRCNGSSGFTNRTRMCHISNFDYCFNNSLEVKECSVYWLPWSNWTDCYEFNKLMNRTRECKLLNSIERCSGNNSEIMKCLAFWSTWSSWGVCNASYGYTNRTKVCNVTNTVGWCYINNSELIECFAIWAQWNNWISCNASNRFLNKTGECKILNDVDWCRGSYYEIAECFEKWSQWSECSKTCGVGTKSRSSIHKIVKTVTESCNSINCPVDGVWENWSKSECSSTCGYGSQLFSRTCVKPFFNGQDCMGVSSYTEVCVIDMVCPVNGKWSMWSPWSFCSQPCGGGVISSLRSCSKPSFGGLYCEGNTTQFTECPRQNCKSVNMSLAVSFPNVGYRDSYSELRSIDSVNFQDKIRNAIAKWHSTLELNKDFYIVVHSIENRP